MRPIQLALAVTILALVAGAGLVVRADTVSLTSDRDNSIYEESGGTSNGAGDSCYTGLNNLGQKRRALMRFDIAANVPAGSTINSVTLTVFCLQTSGGPSANELHRVLTDWGEGSSFGSGQGGLATDGDATWLNTFFPSSLWLTPGGDFDPISHGSTIIGLSGVPYTFGPFALMASDVQGWLDQPATNFGWIILGDEVTAGLAKRLGARENFFADQRPNLTIDFTPPTPQLPGDFNHDSVVNDADVDPFVAVLLGNDTDPVDIAIADIDQSGGANGNDIQPFIGLLIP